MIDTTLQGKDANCYVSVEEADSHFTTHPLKDEWDKVTNKESYLVKATQNVDKCIFKSSKSLKSQSLKFPRKIDKDENGEYFIPIEVKRATFEEALFLFLNEDKYIHQINQSNGLSNFNLGTASGNYKNGVSPLSTETRQLLSPLLLKIGRLK
ncbi:DnaT-like ssDNA-binding protein [Alkalibacillus sp. S2W]|uniref:DnaT-like ssDNA-binding protein n=1 Tax=Alkalibacillus sp. S2W TaxID=3386553 RepID=UPI00398D25ED